MAILFSNYSTGLDILNPRSVLLVLACRREALR